MDDLLTIIIPTNNRHYLLDRTLSYYSKADIKANIIIADSSNFESHKANKDIYTKYVDDLNIEYFHVPCNTELFKKYSISADMVSTPYILTIGDDDFPLKSSLNKLILKLEKDTSIAAIFGERVAIAQISKKTSNESWIKIYPNYSGISNNSVNPLDRIKRLPIPNWQQYQNSIIRTFIFKKSISMVKENDYTQYSEFFFSSMVLVYGTWIKSKLLFAVCHQESEHCKFKDRYLFPHYIGSKGSVFSGISQNSWSTTVSLLCESVAKELTVVCSPNDKDMADILRKIYFSKLFHFLEKNGKLSNFLIDEDSFLIKNINNFFRKISRIYWLALLHDKSGGIGEYFNFFVGLVKEIINGRFFIVKFRSTTNITMKDLLLSIKRTGSLDYESYVLLNKSSRYSKEFGKIFSIWKNNPCPHTINKNKDIYES